MYFSMPSLIRIGISSKLLVEAVYPVIATYVVSVAL